jgi:hypothetical protein
VNAHALAAAVNGARSHRAEHAQQSKALLLVLTAAATLLVGCTTTTYAVFRHPATGDVLECEQAAGAYGGNTGILAPYAECKTSLERRGYVRVGTIQRPPQATSLSETATPRPAPR